MDEDRKEIQPEPNAERGSDRPTRAEAGDRDEQAIEKSVESLEQAGGGH